MDDWGFGIWVVPVALLAALCFVGANHFESGQSPVTKVVRCALSAGSWIGVILTMVLVLLHL
jgi:hypothetical protein